MFWLSGLQNAIQVPLIVSDSLVLLKLLACSAQNTLFRLHLYLSNTLPLRASLVHIYGSRHARSRFSCARTVYSRVWAWTWCPLRWLRPQWEVGWLVGWLAGGLAAVERCYERAGTDIWQDILVAAVQWEPGRFCDTNPLWDTHGEVVPPLRHLSVKSPNSGGCSTCPLTQPMSSCDTLFLRGNCLDHMFSW